MSLKLEGVAIATVARLMIYAQVARSNYYACI